MRQALAGMLRTKQYDFFDADRRLEEHGGPVRARSRAARNRDWFHLMNDRVSLDARQVGSPRVRVLGPLQPNDLLTLNLIYYKILLFDRNQEFGVVPSQVASRSLADEADVILDVSLANWWSMTATFAVAVPNAGFRQAVDGSSTWIGSMLYTNFNF